MVLNIRKYPDPILRKKCEAVKEINEEIKKIAQVMIETEKASQGVGLAAPQVGILKRIIIIRFEDGPRAFINPEILTRSRKKEVIEEGCLSFPGLYLKIKRPQEIEVKVLDINGQELKFKTKGLIARIFQHEIDHLDGILFIDRVSFWQKIKLKNKLKKARD